MQGTATGCYKCGRPGHWSRDCPFSAPNSTTDSATNPNPSRPSSSTTFSAAAGTRSEAVTASKSVQKPKKVPRSRPKLTPELLLSDDGLGYVLRYFPREFKYHGRGHEVRDLGNLLQLYSDWHARLLPYYSFKEFIYKVEKVAATRRVKTCLRELRERVASGGDPTKLREQPVMQDIPADEQVPAEDMEASHQERDLFSEPPHDDDIDIQEDMLNDIYDRATEEPSESMHSMIGKNNVAEVTTSTEVPNKGTSMAGKTEITEEQRARMEANRLKALQRRAARTASSQPQAS